MNRKQRNKNRATAAWLNRPVCSECGERGLHFVREPMSLVDLMDGREPTGFWICSKFYGADGRRLPEHTEVRDPAADLLALVSMMTEARP